MVYSELLFVHKHYNTRNGPLARYVNRKSAGCACTGNGGNVSPATDFKRKLLICDPGMHHGTCVTHVPWCMSGSLTGGSGENVPGIPGACTTRNVTYLVRGPLWRWWGGEGARGKPSWCEWISISGIQMAYGNIFAFFMSSLSTNIYAKQYPQIYWFRIKFAYGVIELPLDRNVDCW